MAIRPFVLLTLVLTLTISALCKPLQKPRSLVLWHGLGDTYSSPGVSQFISEIKEMHPGIYVHSVCLDKDPDMDKRAGFYGNVNDQIDFVANQLAEIPELSNGFDAIGFSQAGQFLRGYVERYNSPPVNNLITFGSQHMGISDIPACRAYDLLCQVARRATKSAVYGEWAQSNLVQAQYFRDPHNMEGYLSANHFLASINNELSGLRNASYGRNLASLNKFVLIIFTEDETVIPKESSWFGSEAVDEMNDLAVQRVLEGYEPKKTIIPMRMQRLYTEDWIGLRELDERGGVVFETCKGGHMQIGDCWQELVRKYAGGYFHV